jgi:flagellar motility protein MotE (MotC chaperone)
MPAAGEAAHGDLAQNIDATFADCPSEPIAVNEYGDAVPTIQDGAGNIVPLEAAEGDNSEQALLGRLSERRGELDKREADLDMRMALLEAAEKKLDERTQQLAALEAQVASLVDEKQAAEDAGFRAIVSMYETMKAKEAAKIFDTLPLPVMLKVARAMSPRKMSPILAAMSAKPAEALTTAMAAMDAPIPVASASGENLAALPQIVGQ